MNRSCCAARSARRARHAVVALLAAAAVAAALLPAAARPHDPSAPPPIVAEALFLCDQLPPGAQDVNLSVAVRRGEPDPATGSARLSAAPRAQLAMALTDRVGFTVDVGFATEGRAVDAPGASLKFLLRPPVPGRAGVAASIDVFGSTRALGETEAGIGVGAIRSLGRFALRAGATFASAVGAWSPHAQAGASVAAALGPRWRALAEVVTDLARAGATVSAGPSVKLALDDATALMIGALFPVSAGAPSATFAVQLGRSL